MRHFGLFKALLVLAVVLAGLVLAAPNLFHDRVEAHNDAAELVAKGSALTPAQQAELDAWPGFLPSTVVNLGLDLRGGVHLLVEVAVSDVYGEIMDGIWPAVRDAVRAAPGVGTVRRISGPAGELRVQIGEAGAMAAALAAARGIDGYGVEAEDLGGGVLVVRLTEAERAALDDRTVEQSLEKIRRRVDEAGTREPSITRQGEDRIVVQVPGLGSAEELMAIIGRTARLSFHPVIRAGSEGEAVGFDELLLPSADDGGWYVVERTAVVGGEELVDSQPGFDQDGRPSVNFRFNAVGARKFGDYTAGNIGKLFAIVLDGEIISAPQIQSHIPGGSGQITGRFTVAETVQLSVLLRAGALPAEIRVLEQRTVGPELGQDSIDAGQLAGIVGLLAMALFMVASYGLFGVFAVVALSINIALILAILSVLGATLTLPGIAGIVLTMGMAVDANVLIFERIREELRAGRGAARAIEQGFERALSAIIDSNITGLLVALIMFALGSGPVRGFAVTTGLGIVTSMFTAVYVTRLIIEVWFAWRRPKSIVV